MTDPARTEVRPAQLTLFTPLILIKKAFSRQDISAPMLN
jgi:hypothetical protein